MDVCAFAPPTETFGWIPRCRNIHPLKVRLMSAYTHLINAATWSCVFRDYLDQSEQTAFTRRPCMCIHHAYWKPDIVKRCRLRGRLMHCPVNRLTASISDCYTIRSFYPDMCPPPCWDVGWEQIMKSQCRCPLRSMTRFTLGEANQHPTSPQPRLPCPSFQL